jgi:hypothetical protein
VNRHGAIRANSPVEMLHFAANDEFSALLGRFRDAPCEVFRSARSPPPSATIVSSRCAFVSAPQTRTGRETVTLPLHCAMTDVDVDRVCAAVADVLGVPAR